MSSVTKIFGTPSQWWESISNPDKWGSTQSFESAQNEEEDAARMAAEAEANAVRTAEEAAKPLTGTLLSDVRQRARAASRTIFAGAFNLGEPVTYAPSLYAGKKNLLGQ